MSDTKQPATFIVAVESARDLCEVLLDADGYVFRGHADCEWRLESSLERMIAARDHVITFPGYFEKWMLHEFRRKYHLYESRRQPPGNAFEWLAVMQHHGCPTRLLDVSTSPFVATYFAVSNSDRTSSLWGFDRYRLRNDAKIRFRLPYKKGVALRDEVNNHHIDCLCGRIATSDDEDRELGVLPVEPVHATERLSRQHGLFLAPACFRFGDSTFNDNLHASLGCPTSREATLSELADGLKASGSLRPASFQLLIPGYLSREVSSCLLKMGISAESLFPGLDGLAKSMWQFVGDA